MGVRCGSQVCVCEYPVAFDTYSGCAHGCAYCFARLKVKLEEIRVKNSTQSLRRFIAGQRNAETRWCDWDIPLHWGGMSDPFQPAEAEGRASLDALRVLAETGYPFIVSTKGRLVAEEPYLSLIARCNCVVQISMVCSSYDRMEPGAPTYEERIEMGRRVAATGTRVIDRVQPYLPEIRRELGANLPRLAEAGFHGITVEGMKFKRRKPGTVKVGGDWCYPEETLRRDYGWLRDRAHEAGLAFYCSENRLRPMGDSTACCGAGDLPGFEGNRFNCVNLLNGEDVRPTPRMSEPGTADAFCAIYQTTSGSRECRKRSFADMMLREASKMRG